MSVRPRLSRTASRSALAALALTAAVGGAVVASGPAAADPAGTAAAVPTVMLGSVPAKPTGPVTSSAGYDFYAGYLAGGATGRYCWYVSPAPGTFGPVAASAGATSQNVIMTTVSTDLENRTGGAWVYCATIRNSSTLGSGFYLYTRVSL